MADSLPTIRKKRAFRRGRLTLLTKKLDTYLDSDLREIESGDIATLRSNITDEFDFHEGLQKEYETILATLEETNQEPEGTLTKEMESGAEHKATYQKLKSSATQLIEDIKLSNEAEELAQASDDWTLAADPTSRLFLEECNEHFKACTDFMAKSRARTTSDAISEHREQIRAIMGKLQEQRNLVKEKAEAVRIESTPIDRSYHSKFDIELPSFNGDPTEWSQYHHLFTATINKRGKHLSSVEKCCLLLKSLKDPKARKIAQLNSEVTESYEEAMAALEERYGQTQVLLPIHISKLKTTEVFPYTAEGLLRSADIFVHTHKALESMKIDLSTFMAALASSHFDDKYSEEWRRHTATLSKLPNCLDLYKFIQSTVSRMPAETKPTPGVNKPKQQHSKQVKQESKTKSSLCLLCNEAVHSISRCPTFIGYTPEKRGKVVKDKRWCNNCLHPAHQSQHCTSTFTCRHCNGKHHSMLHRGDITGNSTASSAPPVASMVSTLADKETSITSSSNDIGGPPVHSFLNTALVMAVNGGRSRTSRVAMDSGSSTSLVTETLATQLKLKRYPHRLSLAGAYSNGSSKAYVQTTLRSLYDPTSDITIKLSVVPKLPYSTPPARAMDISLEPELRDLHLADNQFGGHLDILLGCSDLHRCFQGQAKHLPNPDLIITPSIFGWTVSGHLNPQQSSKFLSIQTCEDDLNLSLQRLWELEQVPTTSNHSPSETSAIEQFDATHSRDSSGRYIVSLPRISSPPKLGTSKPSAISRFLQNEKSLTKKSRLTEFNTSLNEYTTLDHAEIVPNTEINNDSYYLPVHGVFKSSSTTTKVRPVFDASAKTSNGYSLNDLLLAGPNLYPLLTDILLQFRIHKIGFSADISKMFREILLRSDERDFHRFLMRNAEGRLADHRMKRLTFGVKSSPFLATKVLHHLAESNTSTYPVASNSILHHFYVDDFLSGASTVDEAIHIRERLCHLLASAGMNLRKWRTSCPEFRNSIPDNLQEHEDLSIAETPKALGVHWDITRDHLNISTPVIPHQSTITKRFIASQSAKVYDILGFFAPFVVRAKLLLQALWKDGCGWDEEVPDHIKALWNEWVTEVPLIHDHTFHRRYDLSESKVVESSLHGFSDASSIAYGAVVYLRLVHQDGSIHTSLVIAKARVLPLKSTTIPRAELVAAHLLSRLLCYSSNLLHIPLNRTHAWTDSMIVLCWLRKPPSALQLYVANRVSVIQSSLPDVPWRHVPTKENPADFLSRGVSASMLTKSSLWWEGPLWLSQTPAQWSPQDQLCKALPKQVPELKTVTLTIITQESKEADFKLWSQFSSFNTLTRVLAWIYRFLNNASKKQGTKITPSYLLPFERKAARIVLLKRSQAESYPHILTALRTKSPLPKHHQLAKLNVGLDDDGLIRVSGRIRTPEHRSPKQVVALSTKSAVTRLFLHTQHVSLHHPGVATQMAILSESYHIPGLKSCLKKQSRNCATCQKAYARPIQPTMGLLPVERTTPTPPFQVTGLDFAGPFSIKKGHTRRPVIIKAYACLFVCFSTKAIHLELCSDLTTETFTAAFRRFCARRGSPTDVHSDNGTNFVGTAADLRHLQHIIHTAQDDLSHLAPTADINWHFIPPRAPHFGGLWEAGVKNMKMLLKRQLSTQLLTFKELTTILCEVEAILNSRPITPLDSTEVSDALVLTPGHFLIGRPIKSPPTNPPSNIKITSLKRWNLVQKLQQDLWLSWQGWYLRTLTQRSKWHTNTRKINVGDIVLLRDETLSASANSWPLARITHLYPGEDGVTRAADILCRGKSYRRAVERFVPIFTSDSTSIY